MKALRQCFWYFPSWKIRPHDYAKADLSGISYHVDGSMPMHDENGNEIQLDGFMMFPQIPFFIQLVDVDIDDLDIIAATYATPDETVRFYENVGSANEAVWSEGTAPFSFASTPLEGLESGDGSYHVFALSDLDDDGGRLGTGHLQGHSVF